MVPPIVHIFPSFLPPKLQDFILVCNGEFVHQGDPRDPRRNPGGGYHSRGFMSNRGGRFHSRGRFMDDNRGGGGRRDFRDNFNRSRRDFYERREYEERRRRFSNRSRDSESSDRRSYDRYRRQSRSYDSRSESYDSARSGSRGRKFKKSPRKSHSSSRVRSLSPVHKSQNDITTTLFAKKSGLDLKKGMCT